MLTVSIQQIMEHARETEARRKGVSEADIRDSRICGMDARDIANLRAFTNAANLLVVFRCPKQTARAWHGLLPAKSWKASKEGVKSGPSGTAVGGDGRIYVSDYDMMSVWRASGTGGFDKIFMSGIDAKNPRSRFTVEATALLRRMNKLLVTKVQHGAQDDWHSPGNRGVKEDDCFAVFITGAFAFMPNPATMKQFYETHGLHWPYDGNGRFRSSGRR